ncbi:hypothetical protein EVAR_103468_1 [Eumeta japonica]|uniref:Secreted protein n=1 Tax=Eumeta variegata TaxID=151549 RepID=A0A4C1YUD6_EUMVA|nr:hypothetical protein EVAR_103468_1 [Eumeta japonica]
MLRNITAALSLLLYYDSVAGARAGPPTAAVLDLHLTFSPHVIVLFTRFKAQSSSNRRECSSLNQKVMGLNSDIYICVLDASVPDVGEAAGVRPLAG